MHYSDLFNMKIVDKYTVKFVKKTLVELLDQELIPHRYSYFSSSCCFVFVLPLLLFVGIILFKKPEAPSFQIRCGRNLTGLFFTKIRIN